jgi:hypothetical protein
MTHQRTSRDQDSTVSSEKTAPINHDEGLFNNEKAAAGLNSKGDEGVISPSDMDFSHIDESKVLRKMDVRLVPVLALLYLLSFLDRGNIGNAKIEGLADDLHLAPAQYNWCLTVFFFTYCAFEVPSNLM